MNKFKLALLFILNILLDTVILPKIEVFGVSPSVSLAIIVVLSMRAKTEKISYYAILLGIVLDMHFSDLIGIRALSFYLISYYTFKNRRYEGNSFTYGLLALLIGLVLNEFYLYLVRIVDIGSLQFGAISDYITQYLLVDIVMNVIVYILVYLFIENVLMKEKKRFFS